MVGRRGFTRPHIGKREASCYLTLGNLFGIIFIIMVFAALKLFEFSESCIIVYKGCYSPVGRKRFRPIIGPAGSGPADLGMGNALMRQRIEGNDEKMV